MIKSPLKNKCGFSIDSNENYFVEMVDLGYGISFQLLTSEHLLQMTTFEEKVEFGIFYRYPKKFFCPIRVSQNNWQKLQPFVIKGTNTN